MKRFNLLVSVFTLILGVSFLTLVFAQDSTQTKAQVRTKAQYRLKAQSQLQNKTAVNGQLQHGYMFVDENGDGFNDNAPDADGDGIPNGLDPDYEGPMLRSGQGARGFVDLDGDGINDNLMMGGQKGMNKARKGGYGPGDGTGNLGVRPQDGTGFGPGTGTGTGDCDGTGPKGTAKRTGRK